MTFHPSSLLNRKAMATLLVICLGGCMTQAPIVSRLDSSGRTVVTLDDAIVLARPIPQLASAVRDYVYIGPVEINNMGKREHYLWIGLASTIDRKFAKIAPDRIDMLVLFVDGQPMTLSLTNWRTELDNPPYETAAPVYATYAARATLDQIRRIADATLVDVHMMSGTGRAGHYRMWQGEWSSWSLLGRVE